MDGICIIGNVDYRDSRPKQESKLNSICITELKFYVKACFLKFTEWSHEKEFRFVILSNAFESPNESPVNETSVTETSKEVVMEEKSREETTNEGLTADGKYYV